MADFDFENPAYEDDYEDEQAPPLDDTFIEDPDSVGHVEERALPSIPDESADTLRNNQARTDFYDFLSEIGWDLDSSDINKNSLTERGAFIHKDYDGKVYVHHRGKKCYLAKKEVVDLRCQVQSQKMQ